MGGQTKIVHLVVCRVMSIGFRLDLYARNIDVIDVSVSDVAFTMVSDECFLSMATSSPGMLGRISTGPRRVSRMRTTAHLNCA